MRDTHVHAPTDVGAVILVLLVCALAAYWLTRVVTMDSIFEGWRGRLEEWAYEVDPKTGEQRYRLVGVPRWGGGRTISALTLARGKFADWLTCPLCWGSWASAGAVVGAWGLGFIAGGRYFLLWIPATAGIQRLFSQTDTFFVKE
jgi:hypothetical protein